MNKCKTPKIPLVLVNKFIRNFKEKAVEFSHFNSFSDNVNLFQISRD